MAVEKIIDIGPADFKKYGFIKRPDTTAAPIGSLRVMRNAQITEQGGLAPRPGTLLLGNSNASSKAIKGLYNFRKSLGADEILIKCYDDRIEYMSKDLADDTWHVLKTGYTSGSEFGFTTSLVNTDNQDYVAGGNRYEPYFLWTGVIRMLTSALVGGETTVTVDSTLLPDIYSNGTATSNSATTIDDTTKTWAASQWVGFYVHIPGTGQVRKITANTSSQITFDTLGGAPGNVPYEIRQAAFPATGTLVYAGNNVPYTAINTDTTFTVASATAGSVGDAVTLMPTEYPAAPRGNRLCNYLTRIIVGNVRSALTRDAGGALQGYAAAGTDFVSKVNTPSDFSYAATRVAGEGDAIAMPYGGGDITDNQTQEDSFYAFKGQYIESVQYSQDTSDLAVRTPLKAGYGSIGKTTKGTNDIYFITKDKQITTIGRVLQKDIKPEALNIGTPVSRFLEASGADNDVGRGRQIGEKVYFPLKSNPSVQNNDVILVYNDQTGAFEGLWDIGAFALEEWDGSNYYAESDGPDVYEMFVGHSDVMGEERYPIEFEVATHWMNLTASKGYIQDTSGVVVEGYVAGGANFMTSVSANFASDPFLTFNFSFDELGFLDGSNSTAFLGGAPLAIDPESTVYGDPESDGRRHFSFTVRFPFQYANYFSFAISSNDADDDFEVTRLGLYIKQSPTQNANRIKLV